MNYCNRQLYSAALQPGSSPFGTVLQGGKFTLANFNQLMKVSPDIFSVWSGAMLRVSGVRLLLLTGVTSARVGFLTPARNLDREMAVRGLRTARLLRGDALRKPPHLLRASQCSLAVDTLSYNSHTTGSDALWSGLPLLTLSGVYLASRVASSLTSFSGLLEAHTPSLKGYEDTIVQLATVVPTGLARSLDVQKRVRRAEDGLPAKLPQQVLIGAGEETWTVFGTFRLAWDELSTDATRSTGEAAPKGVHGGQ